MQVCPAPEGRRCPIHSWQASEKRSCRKSRGNGQVGAAAYGDLVIADLAAVCIRSLPALPFPFFERIWRG